MSAPVRLVLVGAGAMGRAWIGAIDRSADAELVGLVDLDRAVAEAALAQRPQPSDVLVGTDAVEVARTVGADAVVNVTIPAAHLPVNLAALDAGFPVLCEKPVTPTVRDALVLAAAAETTGRLLMVSQSRRYYAALAALRDRAAELGRVGVVSTEFLKAPHFGGFREEMDHPLIVDMAIHSFDVARYLLGRTPVRVDCRSFNPEWSWFKGDAAATALFEFDGGERFAYTGSWVAPGLETSWNGRWRVGTAEGSVEWDGESTLLSQRGDERARREEIPPAPAESIEGSLAEFVGALRTGATPSGEIHDNVFTLAMVEAAVLSADSAAPVEIGPLLDAAWRAALELDLRDDLRAALAGWGSATARLGAPVTGVPSVG
jgi:predicted dehydrogenase